MVIQLLRRISFFKHLPTAELRRILKIAVVQPFHKGDVIFTKKQAGNHLFIVISGMVKIYATSGGRKRKTFAYLKAGDFFGEMALLEGNARSASAQALEDSKLLLVHKKSFRHLLLSDAEFTVRVLRTLSERLRRANEEIESLLFQNIVGRLTRTLVDLSGNKNRQEAVIRFTHQELADFVGTTREPLTRALSLLKRGGFIDYHNRQIIIKNLPKLREIAR